MRILSVFTKTILFLCLIPLVTTKLECICFENVVTGIKSPTVMYEPVDGSGRLMVVTWEGVIYVYYKDGTKEDKPFLNITDRVTTGAEKGLVGFATHPNIADNGRFYVYYTTRTSLRLSQFTIKHNKPNEADPESEVIMIQLTKQSPFHHAGQLLFDREGYLMVFIGDNSKQGDPFNYGQNRKNLYAAALRLDVTKPANESEKYGIPPDNPFVDDKKSKPEIYAYGLRNPWSAKMDPDPKKGGRIFVGDVGSNANEEISILEKGKNYGWSQKEGLVCKAGRDCNNIPDEVLPIRAYDHSEGNCVIGGAVYRGCVSPSLTGKYIYADYGFGILWYLEENDKGKWINTDLPICETCPEGLTNRRGNYILNFGQDLQGEVYMLSSDERKAEEETGFVQRIVDPKRYEERLQICAHGDPLPIPTPRPTPKPTPTPTPKPTSKPKPPPKDSC